MSPTTPPWSHLYQELLTTITKHLDQTPLDIIHFRSVCKSWNSSSPKPLHFLSSSLPQIIPSLSSLSSRHFPSNFYSLSVTVVYTFRPVTSSSSSSSSWVVFLDEINPGKVSIRNPFTKSDFYMPLDFPLTLCLSDFHVSEMGRFYNVSNVDFNSGKVVKNDFWSWVCDKVVVLSNGSGVVVLYDEGKLGFLELGVVNMDSAWKVIHDGKQFRFDDIIDFEGRVLGIDRRGRVYEMGYCSWEMKVVVPAISGGGGRRKRLIESLGCLYLVVRQKHPKVVDENEFKVYVLNKFVKRWCEVDDIGGRVFLIGSDFSISSDADKFDGSFDGNCVVFGNHGFPAYSESWRFPSSRLTDHPLTLYQYKVGPSNRGIESFLIDSTSSMFWPPPTWLWLNDKSKLRGTFETAFGRLLERIPDDDVKDNYKKLSLSVGAVVADDVISQQELLDVLKQVDVLQKFLNDLILEVEKDVKNIKRSIIDGAVARQVQCKSIDPPNQAGISSLIAEDRNGCTDASQNPAIRSSEDEWLANEISKRLGTHVHLKMFFRSMINVFEKSKKQVSVSAGEEQTTTVYGQTDCIS